MMIYLSLSLFSALFTLALGALYLKGVRIIKTGITFPYHGDTMLWVWPWFRVMTTAGKRAKFVSLIFKSQYAELSDYWFHMGVLNETCRKNKLEGFSLTEILLAWAKQTYPYSTIIVLTNINPIEKTKTFWESIPARERRELNKDIVVMFPNTYNDGIDLLGSIATEFAEAYLIHQGIIVTTNADNQISER